jgi:hypothetical protein
MTYSTLTLTLPSAMSRISGPAKNARPASRWISDVRWIPVQTEEGEPLPAHSSRVPALTVYRSGSRKHIETLEKRIHSLEALLRHDSNLRRSVSYEEGSDSSQHRIESAVPISETADDTQHHARASASEDVHMVIDDGGHTGNIQQSSPAACSPTRFVIPPS